MTTKIHTAEIKLWGNPVGAVSWLPEQSYAVFEYEPSFLSRGWDISPIHMGLQQAREGDGIFFFPQLNPATYLGLPGLLADALPDKFGNAIIDVWLSRQGRDSADFSPVERLCYTGTRGMGALEFFPLPPETKKLEKAVAVEVNELVTLAQQVVSHRAQLDAAFGDDRENQQAILDILRVGTSAGGARPKAVIAVNEQGHVLSGQAVAPEGYDYWIIKFDGVSDLELGEPQGFGRIEYAYYLMATDAGIHMTESRLLEENGRAHFLTKRFDRQGGEKLHLQSLCGLAHYDFNMAGAYSYEQVFTVMRQLRLGQAEMNQQYIRMLFNIMARNQDDHTKNIGFLMGRDGQWRLSPAFDVIYSHNPAGKWTNLHQMSLNGKRDHFDKTDLLHTAEIAGIGKAEKLIEQVSAVVGDWPRYAAQAGVAPDTIGVLQKSHRLFSQV